MQQVMKRGRRYGVSGELLDYESLLLGGDYEPENRDRVKNQQGSQ